MLTSLTAALKRSPGLILAALFLVGLRLSVRLHFTMKWYHPFYALAFEVAAIGVLVVVVRGGLAGRIVARVALGALLFVELAQTVSFHLVKGYRRGYQFTNISFDEVQDAVYQQALRPYGLLGLAACLVSAMLFGRTESLERTAPLETLDGRPGSARARGGPRPPEAVPRARTLPGVRALPRRPAAGHAHRASLQPPAYRCRARGGLGAGVGASARLDTPHHRHPQLQHRRHRSGIGAA